MSHSHRPTTKQQHKPFKSGHASSRTLKDISKGKIQQEKATGCVQKVHTKKDRKNLAKQIQQNKKVALRAQAGYFGDNIAKAARVCALISLSQAAKPQYFVNGLQGYLEEPVTESANANVHIKNFKQRLQFVSPHADTITAILDVASIADTTIFLISAGDSLAQNDRAREVLRALQSQGISSHFSVIPDLKYDPDSMVERTEKRCLELRKMWEADLEQYFPVHHANSLYVMDSTAEIANMLRTVCTTNPDSPSWRVSRTYIVPTARDFDSDGNFFVEGIVRGGSLSADRTVHIPSLGDFQIARVTNIPAGIEEERALATPTDKQDSFTGPHEDVDMVTAATAAAETDANNQDGMLAEDRLRRGVRLDDHYYMEDGEEEVPVVKKVPRGTSEYQATWITDENALNSDEESSEDDDEDMEGNASEDQDDIMSVAGAGAGAPSTYAPTQFEEAHEDLSEEEEARQLAQYQAQVRDDKEFPDEVDFDPHTTTARERFIKYRGLKDFHQSQWDPEEAEPNTPAWYGDILKFTNYKATRNRILKARGSVGLGARVRLHLKDVPRSILDSSLPSSSSSSSSSLLDGRGDGSCVPVVWINREHEQARAINNLTIRLEPDVAPLKSKADLVIQVGHRRFAAQPVFSQAIPRTGNGLVRYERFCQPGRISFATFAGPGIMEKGCPVLFFQSPSSSSSMHDGGDGDGKEGTGDLRLVGTGSFDGIDHTRLLIKRVLLTATPFKIHKRLVTLRYMFHDREDVLFFAAIQLRTKYGRTGFIKEPLGTHGYMKTTWDKQLQGVDTVLMPLYKRIYPRDAHYFL